MRKFYLYWIIGFIGTYLTWPYLWNSPINSLLDFLYQSAAFPWEETVLFNGQFYKPDELPRSYLPTLLALQFTIPALLLFVLGSLVAIRWIKLKTFNRALWFIIALWFFIPMAMVVLFTPTDYDNFRHFFFIIPPMFLFGGLGMEAIFDRVRRSPLKILLLAIFLLPNLYWLFHLHPYQYVFYNQLVGGTGGAFRRYEMDYWNTSYREAALFLNEVAPLDSEVAVYWAPHIVSNYTRDDLKVYKQARQEQNTLEQPYFVILTTRYNSDVLQYPEGDVVFRIGKDGAVFSVVKKIEPTRQLK